MIITDLNPNKNQIGKEKITLWISFSGKQKKSVYNTWVNIIVSHMGITRYLSNCFDWFKVGWHCWLFEICWKTIFILKLLRDFFHDSYYLHRSRFSNILLEQNFSLIHIFVIKIVSNKCQAHLYWVHSTSNLSVFLANYEFYLNCL